MAKINVIFIELCMKGDLFPTFKGNNSYQYQNVLKRIYLESSWKCASDLLHIFHVFFSYYN